MNRIYFLKTLLSIVLLVSCSSDSNNNNTNNLDNFTTDLCTNISGPTAAYYDNAHGRAIPLSQIPTIANPGQQFIHSQYPALGFTMPQGYSGFETQIGLGVDVVRNDGLTIWRYVPGLTSLSQVNILDIVASEVALLRQRYNYNGQIGVTCTQNFTQPQGNFIASLSSRVLDFAGIRAVISINSYFEPSLGSTFAAVTVASGPANEFDNLVMDVFLPIHWQLLIIDNSVRDSDLDGTPDSQDNFPFDPQRQ